MAIDRFAMCPGGTGKKIKFCGTNCFSQLERLEKLIAADQSRAARQQVTTWLERDSNRACLWAYKCLLDRAAGCIEEHAKSAAEFARLFPNSPVALAELAIAQVLENRFEEATESLARCTEQCEAQGYFYYRTVAAMTTVGEWLAEQGHIPAAIAYLWITSTRYDSQRQTDTHDLLREICSRGDVPLELRVLPATALTKDKVKELNSSVSQHIWRFRFSAAEQAVQRYLETDPEEPQAWYCLGNLRLWQINYPGAAEAYLRCAQLDQLGPLGALALLRATKLKKSGCGDIEDLYLLRYEVPDPQRTKEALLSDRHLSQASLNKHQLEDLRGIHGEVAPEAQFFLFRYPKPDGFQQFLADLELVRPLVPGFVLYYGRQTDGPAQIVVTGVLESDRPWVESRVREWLGGEEPKLVEASVVSAYSRIIKMLRDLHLITSPSPDGQWSEIESRLVESIPKWRLPPLEPLTLEEAARDPQKKQWVRMFLLDIMLREPEPHVTRPVYEVWKKLELDFSSDELVALVDEMRDPSLAPLLDPARLSDQKLLDMCFILAYHGQRYLLDRFVPEVLARRDRLNPQVVGMIYQQHAAILLETKWPEWLSVRPEVQDMIAYCEQHGLPHGKLHEMDLLGLLALLNSESASPEVKDQALSFLRELSKHLFSHHLDDAEIGPTVKRYWEGLAEITRELKVSSAAGQDVRRPSEPKIWTPDVESASEPRLAQPEAKKLWVPGMD
ncbi:tetratricopeptide repeat protein [Thermogutta sp.]|uniref:tetratricopeptide repeat protein n=1 Tax=Thermogutta sp. TaxID=1962930 RepID=UPI003C79CD97